MKNFLSGILIVFVVSLYAQDYKTHKVKSGETVETVAKKYLVTPFDLLALNPDAKTNFNLGMTLIIPNSKVKNDAIVEDEKVIIDYKEHRVKRKETLYSLSKVYNITIDEIKKANPSLYAENLRKGDRIRIPRFKTITSNQTISNTIKKYTVQASEGKWRIAHKFGITVQELEQLNPNMSEVIQPGDLLNVPNIANNEEFSAEAKYNYYEVLPKEGFYRLKVKLGLTQEQLEALNPGLSETGLKDGMVLKLPADIDVTAIKPSIRGNKLDLRDHIVNQEVQNLALLLPFRLHRIDADSVAEAKKMIKSDLLLSIALDFHSGVLMALDSAKQLGISTKLKVFDTENRTSKISSILDNEDFENYHAIIGPMRTDNFDHFASRITTKDVPIFAPLAKPSNVLANVYQTIPETDRLSQKMIEYIKINHADDHVLIISDQQHKVLSNRLKQSFPNASQLFSSTKDGKDSYFIYPVNLQRALKKGKNIVFLETDNVAFGSSIISLLNGFNASNTEIILTTTDKGKAFEGTGPDTNYHLSNLKFHYATINKQFDVDAKNGFVNAYRNKYGVSPNKYASRGFDLTLDIVLRIAATEGKNSELTNTETETEYIENKFHYAKKMFGGYVNEASYIVKYDNLKIIEAN